MISPSFMKNLDKSFGPKPGGEARGRAGTDGPQKKSKPSGGAAGGGEFGFIENQVTALQVLSPGESLFARN